MVGGVKTLYAVLLALVLGVGCGKKTLTKEESAKAIEEAIRSYSNKPTGELTKADYERVIKMHHISDDQLTELPKGLEKLTRLTELDLQENPDLTKAQIAELQKALPKCKIYSNPTK